MWRVPLLLTYVLHLLTLYAGQLAICRCISLGVRSEKDTAEHPL